MTPNNIVAIGDIHGQFYMLIDLIQALDKRGYKLGELPFVFLGDMVDGGPETRQVVEWVKTTESVYPDIHVLMGNHEHLMLDALRWNSRIYGNYYLWYMQGGKETAESYHPNNLTPYEAALADPKQMVYARHLDWIEQLTDNYETNQLIFVHAGLRAGYDVNSTRLMDKLWIRDEFIDSDYDWGKRVIYGHTYTKEPLVMVNKIGIDTMHHGHGRITAVVLDDDTGDIVEFVSSDMDWKEAERAKSGLAHKRNGQWEV